MNNKIVNNEFYLEELKIEVTYNCPLSCVHCSSDAIPTNDLSIGKEKFFAILEEAIEMKVKEISFSGGEPLNYENLIKGVELLTNHNIRTNIYTSGNTSKIKEKLETLKSKKVSSIIFSLYSNSEKEHQFITRINNSFQNTINAIKKSIELNINTEVHFVALKSNVSQLKKVVKLASELGIKKISVLRFVPQGRGLLLYDELLTRDQYIDLKLTIENLRKEGFNIKTGSPFNFLFVNNKPECLSAINRLIIAPDLRIYPCDAFKKIKAEEITGNLEYSTLDKYSLKDCWLNSTYLYAIRNYFSLEYEEPCLECNNMRKCLSGCLAQKVLKYGALIKKNDPDCLVN